MIRVVIENILLFLLPTLLYVAYVYVRRSSQSGPPSAQQILDEAPLVWLVAAGALMMLVGLAYFGSYTGGKPGQGYVPPAVRDGQVVPGRKE